MRLNSIEHGGRGDDEEEEDEEDLAWSDSEDGSRPGLPNTFMLEGPVGSGKSAMVYACAKELGFKVLEVNAGQVSGCKARPHRPASDPPRDLFPLSLLIH